MYTKYGLAALVGATSLQQAAAGSVHHRHNHQKRAIEYAATDVVVETVWTTATVTASQQQQQAQEQVATDNAPAPSSTQEPKPTQEHHQPKPKPTSTEEPTAPKPQPTTLTTRTRAKSTREIPEPTTTTSSEQIEAVAPAPTTKINTPVPDPAPTTTTSSEQIQAAAPTPAATGSKRGAAYNDATLVNILMGLSDDITWGYNWGSWRDDNLDDSVDFIPMLWSPGNGASDWQTNVKQAISDGATAILSFNEPDMPSQANMSPEQAASDHQTYMNPYGSSTVRVGAPAVSSSENAGQGLDWLNSWKSSCNGACTFDFCPLHWYGPGGDEGAQLFIEHVKEGHKACDGKPVWITEFATTSGDEAQFMRSAFAQLDELPFVEKYSYFMISLGTLFSSLTSLSNVGNIYANIA